MLAARVIMVLISIVLIGLVLAYLVSSNRRYLRMAARLGVVVSAAVLAFFAVLAYQNWD
jgi:hypothetical protein